MRLLRWLFPSRNHVSKPDKDADLVDAQQRLDKLESSAEERERRLRKLGLESEVMQRKRR